MVEEEEDEEEEERNQGAEKRQPPAGSKFVGLVPDALKHAEPGLEKDKDFRKKLREAKESRINTKAAFPQVRGAGAQIDFRDVLRTSGGPAKKEFKGGVQVDFRDLLKVQVYDHTRGVTHSLTHSYAHTYCHILSLTHLLLILLIFSDHKRDSPVLA